MSVIPSIFASLHHWNLRWFRHLYVLVQQGVYSVISFYIQLVVDNLDTN